MRLRVSRGTLKYVLFLVGMGWLMPRRVPLTLTDRIVGAVLVACWLLWEVFDTFRGR